MTWNEVATNGSAAMNPVNLFKMADVHSMWLAARQVTVASNIANADTPGYQAMDVVPFSEVLDGIAAGTARTNGRHLSAAGSSGSTDGAVGTEREKSWQVKGSGNSVSIEQEFLKAQEVRNAYALDTGTVKAFHRMYLTAVKG